MALRLSVVRVWLVAADDVARNGAVHLRDVVVAGEEERGFNVRRLLAQSVKHPSCELLEGRKLHERKPGRRIRAPSVEAARRAKNSCRDWSSSWS